MPLNEHPAPVRVYVPAGGATIPPRPGSAIVGPDAAGGRVCIDFEDGRYAAAPYAELVARAYGRHLDRYPTVARAVVDRSDLIAVGWYDHHRGEVTVTEVELLNAWHPGASTARFTVEGPAARRREFEQYLSTRPEIASDPALRREIAGRLRVEE